MKERIDWRHCKIGDIGRVVTGRTPSSGEEGAFGNEYPFITPSDMDGRRKIDVTTRYLSEKGASLIASSQIPARSVAVSCIGWQMGKSVLTTRTSFTNQQLNTIIPNDRTVPEFIYYTLSTRQAELKNLGSGGTRTPILNKSRFEALTLKMPPLPIQARIADILSAYDNLIENNIRRIKILEEMARSLYREWFMNFRFPGHKTAKMVASSIGKVPDGWKLTTLGNVAVPNARSIQRGQEPSAIDYVDISSVSMGRVEKIERYAFTDAPGRARRLVQDGDTIWSMVRPNRRSHALLVKPLSTMIVSTGFAVLTPRTVPASFLYLATTTDDFVAYLTNNARGATYPAVTGSDFEQAPLLIATPPLMVRFHEFAMPLFEQSNILHQRNQVLRQTRDLLLPRLISGEIDVSSLPFPADPTH